ncbi:FAD-dependent oxidoreductase [Luteimonas sp. MC1572]|uniref:NAD(P)/FAD-dependent oxidoreductase n=1 Tax=Luteimonas sp. MC1572 TaxID=2799325 RepID=UPI0018F0F2F1|nr:FAD-dependent oxidoreductase [Luteimonas sp. MC1572]MBJ6982667.1 FAD-binding oxidoreductase [Luteimonas sp. MC1572]QQO03910.1 FAD-binding oxidoreductase [Luteimonas sp. MC1572]
MDLKSGYPWWAVKNGLLHAFPPLQADHRCDVAVIGGGITGALFADELAAHGHDVAVFEQRDVGWGSSAASTALLQYEIDTHMVDLARRYGEDNAVLAYRACAEAIPMLQAKAAEVRDVDFARAESLYYASRRRDARALREEFALRQRHGFDVAWLEADAVREQFGFEAPAAILSRLAARMDPYRMAYRLFARLRKSGGAVFDRTTIESIQPRSRDVLLTTAEGHAVRAGHVVIAAGYASQKWLRKRVAADRSSYAVITDPIDKDALGPLVDTMVWETARPYLYMRSTGDGRLLVGGEDDSVDVPARRDARVEKKARKLLDKTAALFPHLPLRPAFSWAGTFAETRDGLPFFGPHPQHGPRVQFAMAYGGNGITYSMIGAGLVRALIERRRHPLAELFSFGRGEG